MKHKRRLEDLERASLPAEPIIVEVFYSEVDGGESLHATYIHDREERQTTVICHDKDDERDLVRVFEYGRAVEPLMEYWRDKDERQE